MFIDNTHIFTFLSKSYSLSFVLSAYKNASFSDANAKIGYRRKSNEQLTSKIGFSQFRDDQNFVSSRCERYTALIDLRPSTARYEPSKIGP